MEQSPQTLRNRIQDLLRQRADGQGCILITNRDIAYALSAAASHVSRELQRLEKDGVIFRDISGNQPSLIFVAELVPQDKQHLLHSSHGKPRRPRRSSNAKESRPAGDSMSVRLDNLERLIRLRERGYLSEDEFQQQKQIILTQKIEQSA